MKHSLLLWVYGCYDFTSCEIMHLYGLLNAVLPTGGGGNWSTLPRAPKLRGSPQAIEKSL